MSRRKQKKNNMNELTNWTNSNLKDNDFNKTYFSQTTEEKIDKAFNEITFGLSLTEEAIKNTIAPITRVAFEKNNTNSNSTKKHNNNAVTIAPTSNLDNNVKNNSVIKIVSPTSDINLETDNKNDSFENNASNHINSLEDNKSLEIATDNNDNTEDTYENTNEDNDYTIDYTDAIVDDIIDNDDLVTDFISDYNSESDNTEFDANTIINSYDSENNFITDNNDVEPEILTENSVQEPNIYVETDEKKDEVIIDNEEINSIDENKINEPIDSFKENNDTLLISEEDQKVYLPYTMKEVLQYLSAFSDKYENPKEVIDNEFTFPLSYFTNITFAARFREAFALYKDREGKSTVESFIFAFKTMKENNLQPAIIAACRNERVFRDYMQHLKRNDLENFSYFKIEYQINPSLR